MSQDNSILKTRDANTKNPEDNMFDNLSKKIMEKI